MNISYIYIKKYILYFKGVLTMNIKTLKENMRRFKTKNLKEQYEQRYYGEKSPYEKKNASILSKGLQNLQLAAAADARLEGASPGQIPHWLADEIYPNIKTKKDWNKLGDDLDKAITMVTNEPMRTTTTRELEKYSFLIP